MSTSTSTSTEAPGLDVEEIEAPEAIVQAPGLAPERIEEIRADIKSRYGKKEEEEKAPEATPEEKAGTVLDAMAPGQWIEKAKALGKAPEDYEKALQAPAIEEEARATLAAWASTSARGPWEGLALQVALDVLQAPFVAPGAIVTKAKKEKALASMLKARLTGLVALGPVTLKALDIEEEAILQAIEGMEAIEERIEAALILSGHRRVVPAKKAPGTKKAKASTSSGLNWYPATSRWSNAADTLRKKANAADGKADLNGKRNAADDGPLMSVRAHVQAPGNGPATFGRFDIEEGPDCYVISVR